MSLTLVSERLGIVQLIRIESIGSTNNINQWVPIRTVRSFVALVRLAQLDWDARPLVLIGDIDLVKEAKDYSHVACPGIRGTLCTKGRNGIDGQGCQSSGTNW